MSAGRPTRSFRVRRATARSSSGSRAATERFRFPWTFRRRSGTPPTVLAPLLDLLGLTRSPAAPIDGFVHPDFLPVATALHRQLTGSQGGAAVAVYHRGACVADLWGGF